MKNILLLFFLLIEIAHGQYGPVIFEGSYGRFLPADGLKFYDAKSIISTGVDPSSVATPGDAGSLFLGSTGILYVKQDSGTTTNWEALPFTSDLTDYAYLPGRAGGQVLTGGTASGDDLTLRSTSNATKGSVIIDETTSSTSTTTGALVVNGGLGVAGKTVIGGRMRVGNSGDPAASFELYNDAATSSVVAGFVDSASPVNMIMYRARGTEASPAVLQANDQISTYRARGWDGDASDGGIIRAEADAEWGTAGDTTDAPTRWLFMTAPDGSGTVTERMRIASTGQVTIAASTAATTTTDGALAVTGGISTGDGIFTGGSVTVTGNTTSQTDNTLIQVTSRTASDTAATAPTFTLRRDRGTLASPTALLANDIIGDLSARGWDTAASIGGYIRFEADADWGTAGDTSDNPTRILFATAPDTSSTVTERMRINSNGIISTTATTDASSTTVGAVTVAGGLAVAKVIWAGTRVYSDGAAGTNRGMQMNTSGSGRWAFLAGSDTESGSNTGSSFVINALDDSGNYIDSPLGITRAAGGALRTTRPFTLDQISAPATPASGDNTIYALSDDNLYMKTDDGTEVLAAGEVVLNGSNSTLFTWPTAAGTVGDTTSFSVTPGIWDISTTLCTNNTGVITTTAIATGFSTSTGNAWADLARSYNFIQVSGAAMDLASGGGNCISAGPSRVSVASTTTYYIKHRALTSISNLQMTYSYLARRVK